MAESREERNARKRKRYHERRAERIANHQCVVCGTPLQEFDRKKTCLSCLEVQRAREAEYRRTKPERYKRQCKGASELYWQRKQSKVCTACGKNDAMEGDTLCEKCRNRYNIKWKVGMYKHSDKAQVSKSKSIESKQPKETRAPKKVKRNLTEAQKKFLAEEKARLARDKKEATSIAIGYRIDNARVRQEVKKAREQRLARLAKTAATLAR